MRLHLCYETLKRISNFSELAQEFETHLAWTETAHFAFASFRKFWSVICERLVGLVSFKTNVSETAGQIHLSDNVRCNGA